MRRPPLLVFGFVALVGGLVPLVLAPPVGGFGDGSELMLVLARGGVAHPTGYPLWTILGHAVVVAFHALGMGWARAAAGWSALGAAVALWFLQLLAWRWAGLAAPGAGGRPAAGAGAWVAAACALAALVLAFDPVWLEQATTAEVYTWHVAWACAAAWCALSVLAAPTARAAALLGFVLGLGLAHHRSSVFVAAPLAVAAIVAAARAAGGRAAAARAAIGLAAALVPLSSFAWVAWRAFHPGPAQWAALDASWRSAWYHVAGGQYRDLLGRFAPDADARAEITRYVYPLLAPALALVALAVARAWKAGGAARAGSLAVAAGVALATAWTFTYGVPDPEAYFLMPLALALAALAPAAALAQPAARRFAGPLLALLALAIVAWAAVGVRASLAARADTLQRDAVVRLMWQSLPDDSSLVFWPGDPYVRLQAYQQLDGEKRSLYVMTPAMLGFAAARKQFAARFGFDPMAGFTFDRVHSGATDEEDELQRLYRALLLHVSARTPHAVYVMVPEQGILRLVPKDRDPSAPPLPAGATAPPSR